MLFILGCCPSLFILGTFIQRKMVFLLYVVFFPGSLACMLIILLDVGVSRSLQVLCTPVTFQTRRIQGISSEAEEQVQASPNLGQRKIMTQPTGPIAFDTCVHVQIDASHVHVL